MLHLRYELNIINTCDSLLHYIYGMGTIMLFIHETKTATKACYCTEEIFTHYVRTVHGFDDIKSFLNCSSTKICIFC